MPKIKNKLRIYRKQYNLTQKQVAQILELKCSSIISRWECGDKQPSLQQALQLSALYKRLVTDIFYDFFCEERTKIVQKEKELKLNSNVTIY